MGMGEPADEPEEVVEQEQEKKGKLDPLVKVFLLKR